MADVTPTEEFLELPGGRVHLLRGGTGEPVLFLHAAGGAGTWLPFHQRLAGRGFEVIAPDHPGFGKSDEFPAVEDISDLVFHYLDVLDGLGLDRPHVVGGSFGGWIAAELAVYAPHRTGSLTLLSDDRVIPVEHARRYAELIPHATYGEVPDCGHAMYFEQPEEFTGRVAAFLNSYPLTAEESGASR